MCTNVLKRIKAFVRLGVGMGVRTYVCMCVYVYKGVVSGEVGVSRRSGKIGLW